MIKWNKTRVEFSTGLKITTRPDPARGFLSPNPTQPDTPAWIVCLNLARTRPPTHLHCFPHTLFIMIRQTADGNSIGMSTSGSGVRSASAPPHEAGSQTYSSPHVNSDDSQQTIYNLQPARNVFYKLCFIKKEAWGQTCRSGLVWQAGPTCWEL